MFQKAGKVKGRGLGDQVWMILNLSLSLSLSLFLSVLFVVSRPVYPIRIILSHHLIVLLVR